MRKLVLFALIAIGFMSCSSDDTTIVPLTSIEEEYLLTLRE